MIRTLFAVYGILVAAVPQRVIDFWEPLAFETAGDAELRPWIIPIARLEGITFLIAALRDEDASTLATLVGILGVPAMVAPRRYLDWGLNVAYRDASEIKVRSWVVPFTRLLGGLYVLTALRARFRDTDSP